MLTKRAYYQNGYTILEVLIAAAISSVITAGLWQLTLSARILTERSFREGEPRCDLPQCDDTSSGFKCVCGDLRFFVIR